PTPSVPSTLSLHDALPIFSNMPGGQGGKDIWMTNYNKSSKTWGTPVNLGPKINTPEDEMFPYISTDGTLYFSSKGHIGMGGLDRSEEHTSELQSRFDLVCR